jgi:hypothetical protein
VIRLLVLIQIFDILGHYRSGPLQIEHVLILSAFNQRETGILTREDHRVIDVSVVEDFEGHKETFDLIPFVLADPVTFTLLLYVTGVLEEGSRRPILKN